MVQNSLLDPLFVYFFVTWLVHIDSVPFLFISCSHHIFRSLGRQLRALLGLEEWPEVKLIYQSHGDALQNDSSFGNKPLYCID